MSSSGADPTLPPELERQIFEIAAFLHPESMPALLGVARRVKIWIEPLLYEVLCISLDDDQTERMFQQQPVLQHPLDAIHSLIKSRPSSFFHDHVRHISFWDYGLYPADDIIEILAVCDATVNLTLLSVTGGPELLSLLGALQLQRLTVAFNLLFPALDFAHPLFAQITHLDVYDNDGWETWSNVSQIPRLTHLSFHESQIPNPVCQGALTHCKALEVLVIVCSTQYILDNDAPDRAALAPDPRFVMLVVVDPLVDWETGARGGEDYWDRAEAFVEKRRSGETKGYFITAPCGWRHILSM
ncbi:hypothetical protein B0H10DRAFT_1970496 [Mycena sp. CBHHK59/15]|nr:hypothetical protein B0H10DRAFT_1970496 [Mycena sp. CBHHK59/15]